MHSAILSKSAMPQTPWCAGKHATLHNFRFIFRTSRSSRTLRFPYTEDLSFLGFRPVSDMLLLPVKYL
jgi:hypothetical protein